MAIRHGLALLFAALVAAPAAFADDGDEDARAARQPTRPLFGGSATAVRPAPQPQAQPIAGDRKIKRRATARRRPVQQDHVEPTTAKLDNKQWWAMRARPLVVAFQLCLAGSAKATMAKGPTPSAGELIAEAVDHNCRSQFDAMADTLVRRVGVKGFAEVSRELIDTVFVPTATRALTARSDKAAKTK